MVVYVWSGCSFLVGVLIGLAVLWRMRKIDSLVFDNMCRKLMRSFMYEGSLPELEVRKLIQKALDDMKIELTEEDKPRRRWIMPDEKAEEMFALYTKWDTEDDRAARYRFWKMVQDQFPETKGVTAHFDDDVATEIVIWEGKHE